MKRLTLIVFVIALLIVAYETFRPQAKFPATDGTSFVPTHTAVAVAQL